MTKTIKISLLLIFLFALSPGYAQDAIEYREIPEETINDLKNNKDLEYPLEVGEKAGWFQKLFEFIVTGLNWINQLLNKGGLSKEFLYFISFIAAGILVWLLLRSKYSWVFSSGKRDQKIDYNIHQEDIHTIDFEEQIKQAVQNEDFRLAVRLAYLQTLKLMSDNQFIYWSEGKTNNQYARELKDARLKDLFAQISYQFNYLWYGHFDAQAHHYETAQRTVSEIKNHVKK